MTKVSFVIHNKRKLNKTQYENKMIVLLDLIKDGYYLVNFKHVKTKHYYLIIVIIIKDEFKRCKRERQHHLYL